MYAHIEPLTSQARPPPPSACRRLGDDPVEVGGPAATRITLFDGTPGPATDFYQVMAIETGTAGGQQPTHARVAYFDGPRAPEQAAAEDFAGKQRLLQGPSQWPQRAGRRLGAARAAVGFPVVCTLATSMAELDAITQAVMATRAAARRGRGTAARAGPHADPSGDRIPAGRRGGLPGRRLTMNASTWHRTPILLAAALGAAATALAACGGSACGARRCAPPASRRAGGGAGRHAELAGHDQPDVVDRGQLRRAGPGDGG